MIFIITRTCNDPVEERVAIVTSPCTLAYADSINSPGTISSYDALTNPSSRKKLDMNTVKECSFMGANQWILATK